LKDKAPEIRSSRRWPSASFKTARGGALIRLLRDEVAGAGHGDSGVGQSGDGRVVTELVGMLKDRMRRCGCGVRSLDLIGWAGR